MDAQALRRFLNRDAQRLDALLPDNPARMRGFFIVIVSGLLMIVDQINVARAAFFKAEDHPPVRPDSHAPEDNCHLSS